MPHIKASDNLFMFPTLMKRKLANITLLGVDHNMERLKKAFEICEYYFDFAEKKLITTTDTEMVTDTGVQIINKEIDSIEAYSHFMIKELNDYVQTDYVLIVHHDGFILNPDAWTDEFLQYDYIGAPWRYKDDKNVGNGGFSLRSKKLLELLANDPYILDTHPEDDRICRMYGDYLKSKGIRFAPEELAKKFSIE